MTSNAMTAQLPPNLLALFAARPPLRWVEPADFAPEKRTTAPIDGLAAFLPELEKYKQTDEYKPTESWLQARDRKEQEKKDSVEKVLVEGPKKCEPPSHHDGGAASNTRETDKPNEDPNIRGDAFKTLIVARLSYEADERDLEKEFGRFGPIERVRHVTLFDTTLTDFCRFALLLILMHTRSPTRRRSPTEAMPLLYSSERRI